MYSPFGHKGRTSAIFLGLWRAPGSVFKVKEGAIRFGLLLWEMLFRAVPYGDFSIAQPLGRAGLESCCRIEPFLLFFV